MVLYSVKLCVLRASALKIGATGKINPCTRDGASEHCPRTVAAGILACRIWRHPAEGTTKPNPCHDLASTPGHPAGSRVPHCGSSQDGRHYHQAFFSSAGGGGGFWF